MSAVLQPAPSSAVEAHLEPLTPERLPAVLAVEQSVYSHPWTRGNFTDTLAAGLPIGKSLAEPDLLGEAKAVIAAMAARGAEVPIPTDVVCAKAFAADAPATVKKATEVAADDLILDIGPETAARLAAQLKAAGTIVWNGPVGVFEFDQFAGGTQAIAEAIAESSAFSIAGGGDTLAAIAKYGITQQVGYISTGGGAFLEVLEGKQLPAFEILQKRAAG